MSAAAVPVRFRHGDVTVQSFARAVTESTMFVPCPRPPDEGTRLRLRLFLDNGDPAEAEAIVRKAIGGDRPGFRCELVEASPAARGRLCAVLPAPAAMEPIE